MTVDFTASALTYAVDLGWPVLPLTPGGKLPVVPSKEGGRGVHDATTERATIEAWGRRWPNANVGIACGEVSKLVVIDVDPRNGGDVTMRTLAARGYAFPRVPRARTGNGGWHLFLQYAPGVRGSAGRIGPGVDVKSSGGFVVAAPSWTAPSAQGAGGRYRWEVSPSDASTPAMPVWLLEKLAPPKRSPPRPLLEPPTGDVSGLAQFVRTSQEGERNRRLFWAACRARELISSGIVSEGRAIAVLADAAGASGLDLPSSLATIQSGLHGPASTEKRHG